MISVQQRSTPFLWFDTQAVEAARFSTAIFPNSRIGDGERDELESASGTVSSVSFVLDGQPFIGLNGGLNYPFTPAISFFIRCETQAEVDHYWERLSAGGHPVQCGWLRRTAARG